ncbi:MAG: hypothetical protein NVSMB27_44930 [Ktedonobacteraceae bacterium]
MDLLRETAPFLVGLIVPPLVMLVIRAPWSGQRKFLATFLPALILGACTSAVAGELAGGISDALIAVMIDTALVYTASQLAYRLIWKPILEERLQRAVAPEMERVRQ